MKRIGLLLGTLLLFGFVGIVGGELIQQKFTNPGQVFRKELGPLGTVTVTPNGIIQGVANGSVTFNPTLYSDSGDTLTTTALAFWGRSILGTWTATEGTFTFVGTSAIYNIPSATDGTYTITYAAIEGSRTYGVPPGWSVATQTREATATVIVSTPKVKTVAIVPGTASLTVNGTCALSLDIRNQTNNPMPDITGTFFVVSGSGSVTPNVGTKTVYTAGTGTGIVVIGGTVTNCGNVFFATATLTVNPGHLVKIEVIPGTVTVNVESTQTFVAQGRDTHGNAGAGTYSFSLVGDAIGTISPTSGTSTVFTGTASGSCVLYAESNGIIGSATITVVVPPPYWSPIPSPQTAGTGFVVSLRISGFNGVATITAALGSCDPSTVTVVAGKWDGFATVTAVGSETLTATSSTGAVAISNEFLVFPGPPKGLKAEGLPIAVIVGRPLQGTATFIIVDSCGNETKLQHGAQLSFVLYPSWDGGATFGAALSSIAENLGYYYQVGNKLALAAGISKVEITGSILISKITNTHLGDMTEKVCVLEGILDY
jgi:hypothetical protein